MQGFLEANTVMVLITLLLSLGIFFQGKLRNNPLWHATVTPLASIIGSGFLVVIPLLVHAVGQWALLGMLAIVLAGYGAGDVMRYNILEVVPKHLTRRTPKLTQWLDAVSHPVLAFSYVISVAFYLKILSSFVLYGFHINSIHWENILTTVLLLLIAITGKLRGLAMLESYEIYVVNSKLCIILALLAGMLFYNVEMLWIHQWEVVAHHTTHLQDSVREIFGMIIVVQGFETSRYLGDAYPPLLRAQTMRYAQWISSVIYILFIALAMVMFQDVRHISEKAIIDLSGFVTPILPVLLIFAAVFSQFGAAVADTIGSGGLLSEWFNRKISVHNAYIYIGFTALCLVWTTNIYEIVTIASRAFAIYYAMQTMVALLYLFSEHPREYYLKKLWYLILFVLMCSIVFWGKPVS